MMEKSMRSLMNGLIVAACLVITAPALAHTVWLVPAEGEQGGWLALFGGHAGKIDEYPPERLKEVSAIDGEGRTLAVRRTETAEGVRLHVDGAPMLITAHFDNDIHTKRTDGPSVRKPMNEVPNAVSATRAVKYNKTVASWQPGVTEPVGQPFEVVPLGATQPVAGEAMRVKVLIDGKPAEGIGVAHNEEGKDIVTDAQGVAEFVPVKGFNKLWSGRRSPVEGNPAYTELSVEYTLGFEAQ
jgi:nickel transport protein